MQLGIVFSWSQVSLQLGFPQKAVINSKNNSCKRYCQHIGQYCGQSHPFLVRLSCHLRLVPIAACVTSPFGRRLLISPVSGGVFILLHLSLSGFSHPFRIVELKVFNERCVQTCTFMNILLPICLSALNFFGDDDDDDDDEEETLLTVHREKEKDEIKKIRLVRQRSLLHFFFTLRRR